MDFDIQVFVFVMKSNIKELENRCSLTKRIEVLMKLN